MRVTQQQMYETVMALDAKLSGKIDAVLAAVNDNRVKNAGEFACMQEGLKNVRDSLEGKDGLKDRLEGLEGSETRWRALTAVVSAGAGAFFGWLTGRA